MADGSITFSTALDNSDLEKQLKATEKRIEALERKLEGEKDKRTLVEAAMERGEAAIHETEAEIDRLRAKLQELGKTGMEDPRAYMAAQAQAEAVKSQLSEQEKIYAKQVKDQDALNEKWQQANDQVELATSKVEQARGQAAKLGAEYQQVYSTQSRAAGTALTAMEARFATFAKKINTRMKKMFVFSFIFAALATFKKYLTGAIAEDDRFAASVNGLVATLRGIAAPIVGVLIPVLTTVVNVLTAMITTLARLVDMVFRTDLVGSINNSIAAMQASQGAADAIDEQAGATKRLAKEQKKAARWLAAFDELNVMQANDSNDAADALGDQAAVTAEPATWAGIDVGKIDDTLAQIMVILGAALMAVGAILAFSGINIPLGLTLLALGALMVYTAVQERWGALPQELRDAINAALVLTGIVLLVIGAVLAFSGANLALGIGMMLAGAVLLATAAAINWDALPTEVQFVVDLILTILGGSLLVIGAILALSGANIPLGVGLMLAGAVALGSMAMLNWDTMSDEVRMVVVALDALLGAAFIVIGGVLAFSGANIPLGIALIGVGAAALVSAAALAWNSLPDSVRGTVSTILGIVGGALLVVGIILCVTGIGIPLGIACIIAGIGSMVAAAAINWNFLRDKVAEIWEGIRSYWNTHIAKYFTWSFWEGVFKNVANGLIQAVNAGLNAFGGFINNIASGISGVLNWLGVKGWYFTVRMPQIPYLAEGAVIPPNRKFMAVLGDQTSGNNIEAPEALIRQIVREESGAGFDQASMQAAIAAAIAQAAPMLRENGGDVVMELRVGNEVLAQAVNRGNASLARRGMVRPELAF